MRVLLPTGIFLGLVAQVGDDERGVGRDVRQKCEVSVDVVLVMPAASALPRNVRAPMMAPGRSV